MIKVAGTVSQPQVHLQAHVHEHRPKYHNYVCMYIYIYIYIYIKTKISDRQYILVMAQGGMRSMT